MNYIHNTCSFSVHWKAQNTIKDVEVKASIILIPEINSGIIVGYFLPGIFSKHFHIFQIILYKFFYVLNIFTNLYVIIFPLYSSMCKCNLKLTFDSNLYVY